MHPEPSPTVKITRHRNRKSESSSLASMKSMPICNLMLVTKCLVLLIGLTAGYLHWLHVSTLHENDLFFSHLSSTEREMTFGTEMGFYYSYYKQLITAPNMSTGWNSLLADSRSEHPPCIELDPTKPEQQQQQPQHPKSPNCQTINAMQRFNLYPELLLASLFRFALDWNLFGRNCYQVNRELPAEPIAIAADPKLFESWIHGSQLTCNQSLTLNDKSVLSCVGPGEPIYFYVNSVFILSSLILIGLSLSGWIVARSGSNAIPSAPSNQLWLTLWGSILPVGAYFFNHREATRVQWTPPLRESFAYPFFILQQTYLISLITVRLREDKISSTNHRSILSNAFYCLLLLCFQLPWQFSQFALATQVASLYGTCCLIILANRPTLQDNITSIMNIITLVQQLIWTHLIGLILAWLLQFGNTMLLTTGYLAGLIGILIGLRLIKQFVWYQHHDSAKSQPIRWVPRHHLIRFTMFPTLCAILCALTLNSLIKALVALTFQTNTNQDEDDGGHIWDMLLFKFFPDSHYRNFHTLLYTCAPEFDFIGWNSLSQPFKTGLLINSTLACLMVLWSSLVKPYLKQNKPAIGKSPKSPVHDNQSPNPVPTTIAFVACDFVSLFIVIQLFFFTLMATLIMRLKLFWTPQMCLALAILAQPIRLRRFFNFLFQTVHGSSNDVSNLKQKTVSYRSNLVGHLILGLVLAHMAYYGVKNLQAEWAIEGSFVGDHQEVLVNWLRSLPARPQTNSPYPSAWVLSGPLSVMGSLRLLLPAPPPYPTPQPLKPGQPGFAFTNHPHYENAELRQRTILASAIYGRKSPKDVWYIYRNQLKTNFVLVETQDCLPRQGCSKPELLDLVNPDLVHRPALCQSLATIDVTQHGQTPDELKPYFSVVYAEPKTGRIILYVNS